MQEPDQIDNESSQDGNNSSLSFPNEKGEIAAPDNPNDSIVKSSDREYHNDQNAKASSSYDSQVTALADASSKSDSCHLKEEKERLPSLGIMPDVEPTTSYDYRSSPESKVVSLPDPSEVIHKVKRIRWRDVEAPIITQNNNGPCPLLAILNAMILKGKITLPKDRQELTGGELVSIIGNAVFDVPRSTVPSEMHQYLEQNTEDAVNILHKLLTGLDVNVKFSGVRDFEFTPELSIFDVLDVPLYHGWVVDPESEAACLVTNLSYNQLTNNIIMWRDQAEGDNDDTTLLKAMLCEEFMCDSVSQLTIHGLFELGAALNDNEVGVLFRNNHFSTIYKQKGRLYQLLTDQGFLMEKITWETLTDIDANFSEFVDGDFEPFQQDTPQQDETELTKEQQINSDHQLAAMLQHEAEKQKQREEEFSKIVDDLGLRDLSDEEIARRLQDKENELVEAGASSRSSPSRQRATPSGATRNPNDPPRPSSRTQHQRSPSEQSNRKKKDCVIL